MHDYLVTYKVIGGVPSFVVVFCCHRGKQNGGSLVSRDGYFGSNEFFPIISAIFNGRIIKFGHIISFLYPE